MAFHLIPLLIGAGIAAAVGGTAYVVYRYRNAVVRKLQQLGRLASKVWRVIVKVVKVGNQVLEAYNFLNGVGSLLHSSTQYDDWYSTYSDVRQSINNYGSYSEEYDVSN